MPSYGLFLAVTTRLFMIPRSLSPQRPYDSLMGQTQRRISPPTDPIPGKKIEPFNDGGPGAGKILGRLAHFGEAQRQIVLEELAKGISVSALAKRFSTSRQTIMRARDDGSQSVLASITPATQKHQ